MQGKLKGVSGRNVMLELDKVIDLPIDADVDVTIKLHRDKRSLSANAYFHVLVDKLRTALKIGFTECKNDLITAYGQIEYIGDEQVIIKTNIPADKMRQSEVLHCLPVKISQEGGRDIYFYRVYRGSHTYDSREMAQLIDGTISEIKHVAPEIEVLTPNELARLDGYAKYIN